MNKTDEVEGNSSPTIRKQVPIPKEKHKKSEMHQTPERPMCYGQQRFSQLTI